MVLLVRIEENVDAYTALHLHSTMVLLVPFAFVCFSVPVFAFTFHYGSISTNVKHPSSSILKSFTFHYGSISTC